MDAIQFLTQQHGEVESLFAMLKDNDTQTRATIINKLNAHTRLEETYFYPALEKNEVTRKLTEHSREEHEEVKQLIADWMDVGTDFMAGADAVKAAVQHHVKEEEEEMFPAVREAFSSGDLERLGWTMESAFAI
jgi:hemerythrin-like domain-containing protein